MDYQRLLQPPRIILTPRELLKLAVEYFEWAESTPLLEEVVFQNKGDIIRDERAKMRALTKRGLATFLGMTAYRLDSMRARGPEWEEVIDLIDDTIYTQKFEGAAASLLNSQLIVRDLGLADKQEMTGANGSDIRVISSTMTPEEARERYLQTLEASNGKPSGNG